MSSKAELRATLKSLGGNVQGNLSVETLEKRIHDLCANMVGRESPLPMPSQEHSLSAIADLANRDLPPRNDSFIAAIVNASSIPPATVKIGGCSEEQVLTAIKSNIDRGMDVWFSENCWYFKRKDRSDSGTMSQPIYNIKKCADLVCVEAIPAAKLKLS